MFCASNSPGNLHMDLLLSIECHVVSCPNHSMCLSSSFHSHPIDPFDVPMAPDPISRCVLTKGTLDSSAALWRTSSTHAVQVKRTRKDRCDCNWEETAKQRSTRAGFATPHRRNREQKGLSNTSTAHWYTDTKSSSHQEGSSKRPVLPNMAWKPRLSFSPFLCAVLAVFSFSLGRFWDDLPGLPTNLEVCSPRQQLLSTTEALSLSCHDLTRICNLFVCIKTFCRMVSSIPI